MFTKIYTEQLNLPETMEKTVEVGGRGRNLSHYRAQISQFLVYFPILFLSHWGMENLGKEERIRADVDCVFNSC